MEGNSNSAGSRELYVTGICLRTAGMIRILFSMQDVCQGQMDRLLRQLRERTKAGPSHGFDGTARLCQSMEACLAKIDGYEKPRSEAAISALIESSQVIAEHAETISRIAGWRARTRQWRHATAASPESPKTMLCTNITNPKGGHNGKSTQEPR